MKKTLVYRWSETIVKDESMKNDIGTTSLADQIAAFTAGMAKAVPPDVIAVLGAELKKSAESGIAKKALQVGEKAPDFSLPDARKQEISLAGLLARGPAVVTFYRGGWCPFCNLQLRAYQSVLPEIRGLGAELVAISPQTIDYVLSDVEQKGLVFPVLSDLRNSIARQYGLVYALSDALKQLQQKFNNPIPKFNGDDSWELPMPGTFLIDPHGIVRLAHVDPNYMKRLEPAAILDALRKWWVADKRIRL
jgi:peroxiredoxin